MAQHFILPHPQRPFLAQVFALAARLRGWRRNGESAEARRQRLQHLIDTQFPDHNDDDDDTWQPEP